MPVRTTFRGYETQVEGLLSQDFMFELTAQFESDPSESQQRQYWQISGRHFFVSTKYAP